MKKWMLLVACCYILSITCRKEYSAEGRKLFHPLPSDYPFATGICNQSGASLGIPIIDTVNYIPADSTPLPSVLLLDMPTPGNQESQGSCAAWATIYSAGTYYQHISLGKEYSDTGNLSPKYTYNQIAKGKCTCTSLLDNLYLLKTQGACSLTDMPYNPDECEKQPDSLQKQQAGNYKIKDWQKVDLHNLILIKRAIREKKPVIFSINVDETFEYLASPYIWKTRTTEGSAHGLVVTGFDDKKTL